MYDKYEGLTSLFKAVPVVGTVVSTFDFFNTLINISEGCKDTLSDLEKKLTYVANYATHKLQIENGGLRKDGAMCILSSDDKPLLVGPDGHLTFDYLINGEDGTFDTRFAAMLTLGVRSVTTEDGKTSHFGDVFESTSIFTKDLYNNPNKEYKEIPEIEFDTEYEDTVRVLPYYYNLRKFTPKFTGNYSFDAINNLCADFKIIKAKYTENGMIDKDELSDVVAESSPTVTGGKIENVHLNKGETYLLLTELKAKAEEDGINGRYGNVLMKIRFNPLKISEGDNDILINDTFTETVKLEFDKSYFYKLSCNNENATFKVLDRELNLIETGAGEIRVECGKGNIKYVEIEYPEETVDSVTVSCVRERDVAFVPYHDFTVESYTAVNDIYNPLPALQDNGYEFGGWWDNEHYSGTCVTDDNIADTDKAELILYAKWTPIVYDITYVVNGGTEINDEQYTVEEFVALNTDILKEGHVFIGWFDNPEFTGDPVTTISAGSIGDRTFYAKWVLESYVVTLDLNAGQADNATVFKAYENGTETTLENFYSRDYGKNFVLPEVKTEGFLFEGWFYGDTRITTEKGESLFPFAFEENVILTAKWTREMYTVKIVLNSDSGEYVWLINNGISDSEAQIEYSRNLCPNCLITQLRMENSSLLYREGYIFHALLTEDNKVACWGALNIEWENGKEYLVYANYNAEKYTVYFEGFEEKELFYNDKINYPTVTKRGYDFKYWQDWNKNIFNINNMPDLTQGTEGNGSIRLYPYFTVIDYSINYVIEDDVIMPNKVKRSYTVEESVVLPTPTKAHYIFGGWYDALSGEKIDLIEQGTIGNIELVAHWQARMYTVRYISNANFYKYDESFQYAYGTRINLMRLDSGYYQVVKWNDYDSNASYVVTGNITFTAVWKGKESPIMYSNILFGTETARVTVSNGDLAPRYYEYNIAFDLTQVAAYFNSNGPYSPQMRFLGWYTSEDFSTEIKTISAGSYGPVYVYAKWRYDYTDLNRTYGFTVTDKDEFTHHYDFLSIELGRNNQYAYLKALRIQYLKIEFSIRLHEVADGYQWCYLYAGSGRDKLLWSTKIEHSPHKTDSTSKLFKFSITVNIDDIKDVNTLYFRYKGDGAFSDDWVNEKVYAQIMFVTKPEDSYSPSFFWEYQRPTGM